MTLQDFIIANADKDIFKGGSFVFDDILLHIRSIVANPGADIEVSLHLPIGIVDESFGWYFSKSFDYKGLGSQELVWLHNWLINSFFPAVETELGKYFQKTNG